MAIKVAVPKEMESLLKNHTDIIIDVRIGDYLNTNFLRKYTKFKSYEEFVEFSPYTEEELAENSNLFETKEMDRYIELTTGFNSYAELFSFAVQLKLSQAVNKKISEVKDE
ncbi:MAG: hypothetical protein ACI4VL_04995 [Bacilli bacterium]